MHYEERTMAAFLTGTKVWVIPEQYWKSPKPWRGVVNRDYVCNNHYDALFHVHVRLSDSDTVSVDQKRVFYTHRAAKESIALLTKLKSLKERDRSKLGDSNNRQSVVIGNAFLKGDCRA
jgi:hypothetical protein